MIAEKLLGERVDTHHLLATVYKCQRLRSTIRCTLHTIWLVEPFYLSPSPTRDMMKSDHRDRD